MDREHTQKPIRRGLRYEKRDDMHTGVNGHAVIVQDGDTGFAGTAPAGLSGKLGSELFARLLLELPEHRRDLQSAYQDGNSERLARAAHKLLGAVVYCELPELAGTLRELKRMTGSGDAGQAGSALGKAIRLIDDLLACSGYRSD